MATARRYGRRFAEVVRHWKREGDYVTERYVDAATLAALRKIGMANVPDRVA